jgi:hypothetical protein
VLEEHLNAEQVKDFTLGPNLWARLANSFGVAVEDHLARIETDIIPRMLP